MKIVEQSHEILYPRGEDDWHQELVLIERAGRTAYKSEGSITPTSHFEFIEKIIKRNHLAVIEFGTMMVHFVTDRGITHEIVRHRLCSFLQESTRYCNYTQDKFGNEISFIMPGDVVRGNYHWEWEKACVHAEHHYLDMITRGETPQTARAVLPNCTKTEICVRANFREWRHIFQLREISKAAHPDMRRLMIPLYEQCRIKCPAVFEMGDPE